ncbi:aldoxime dehydratase [Aspergillus vadensis CBS 113365]|uniref:Aldoxime dehydratase n=1 Tax=Aspergillus vadensis (strain CBS 113365 / IMI 142717 / IBT 24658) TaxID=1448311 RepID=A0A319B3E3_ASPVC|nr:aldoxime dehydratase [Aspergillus vadensis CBS 113365]PYH66331.1 aldoxime dehydratase [Aspergillus vadensis CBS 113365]
MFLAFLPPNTPITVTITGTNSHTPPNLTTTLTSLFASAQSDSLCAHTETLHQHHTNSTIHLTYWSTENYKTWLASPQVSAFFSSLDNDSAEAAAAAGIYHETLTIQPSRIQGATNHPVPSGCMHLGKIDLKPELSGYWGCYPDRIGEKSIKSSITKENISAIAESKADIEEKGKIIPGKQTITHIPDNICFVVEGQDHSAASAEERTYWAEHFDSLSQEWVGQVLSAGLPGGVVSSRGCYNPSVESTLPDSDSATTEAGKRRRYPLTLGRDVQLLYFVDLQYMETLGRKSAEHVKLRKAFMEAYGPGGVLFGGGLKLWVETAVLRDGDFLGEYWGCVQGTGLLGVKGVLGVE